MTRRMVPVCVLALVFVVAAGSLRTARAQAIAERGVDVFVAAGPAWTWSDESYLGTGVVAGAGIGYRLGRLGLEAVVDHRRNSPDFGNDVVFKARRTRAVGRLVYYFGRASARPYVGGAIGYSRVRSSSDFPDDCAFVDHQLVCRSRRRFSSTETSGGLGAVAGVRVALRERWFVRPEFEFGLPGESIMMSATVAVGRSW